MKKIFTTLSVATLTLSGCAGLSGNVGGFDLSYISTGMRVFEASEGYTEKDEYFLGRGVSSVILGKHRTHPSSRANEYMNRVGATLVAVSDRPETYGGYHFQILDTDEINAISAPGGFIFITRGLLELLPDEEALAGVLAHEIAHVALGHGRKAVQSGEFVDIMTDAAKNEAAKRGGTATRMALAGAQMAESFGAEVTGVVDTLLVNGYSRSQEYDSDEYAAQLMVKAGYDPRGLVTVLRKLEELEQSGKSSGGLFSTHPSAEDRIDEVEGIIEDAEVAPSATAQLRAQRFKSELRGIS